MKQGVNYLKKLKAAGHPAILILVAGLAVSLIVVTSKPHATPGTPVESPWPELPAVRSSPAPESILVRSQGTVAPRTQTRLVAQVSGKVEAVSNNFVAGGYFQPGEVILSIDPRDYEIALAQARSAYATSRQLLAEEKGLARQAKREWRDLGDQEANDLFLRKPQLAAAEAAVAAARANVERAELDLSRTRIQLPYAGRVLSTDTDLGQFLTQGSVIAEVYASDVLEVRLPLTANQVQQLGLLEKGRDFPGLPVRLYKHLEGRTLEWEGQLVRMEASVDTQTRLFYAVAEIQATGSVAAPTVGMFVDAEIASLPVPDIDVLPRTALVNRNQVMTVHESLVEPVTVDVLQVDDQLIHVRGLDAGATVLISPPGYLGPGMHVKPVLQQPDMVLPGVDG